MSDYNQEHIKKNLIISRSDKRREPSPINIRADLQEGFAKLEKQQEKQREIRSQELVRKEEPKQPVQEPQQSTKKLETPQDIKAEAKKKQITAAKKSKEDAVLMERRGLTGSIEEERLNAKVKKLGKLPMYGGILGSGGAAVAGMVKKATEIPGGLSKTADIAGSLIPGLGMLGGLSMGLSKSQQAQRIRSAKQSENQLGTAGKVSQVAGSTSMLRTLPMTMAGIGGLMAGDPLGMTAKVGKTMMSGTAGIMGTAAETASSAFGGASKLAGKAGLDTTSSMLGGAGSMAGGLSGMIGSSPLLAPGLALALPGIISGITSIVVAKKRLRIRGKRETKDTIIKKFGEPQSMDGFETWINRVLLDPSSKAEDRQVSLLQLIIAINRSIKASASVLPEMAVMLKHQEDARLKDQKAGMGDVQKLKEKWEKTEIGGMSVALGNFANDVVDRFTLFSQKVTTIFDPFKQVTDLLFKGKTPLAMINEQEALHGTRIAERELHKKVQNELGIRYSDVKLLSMSGSALAQMADQPEGKNIILLSAIKDVVSFSARQLATIRAIGFDIPEVDVSLRPTKKKGFFNMLETIGMSIPIVATATAIISTAVKTIPKVIKFPGEMYSQFKGFLKKRRDSEVKVFKELAEKQQKLFEKEGIAVSDEKAAQIYFAGPFPDLMGDMKRIGLTQVELLQNIFAVAKQQFEMFTGSTFAYQETQAVGKQQMVYDAVTGQYVLPSEYQEILTERLEKAEEIQSKFISSQFKSQRKEDKAFTKLEKFRLKDIEKTGTTDLQSMDEIKAQSFKQIESGAIGRIDAEAAILSGFGQLQTGFGDFINVIKDKFDTIIDLLKGIDSNTEVLPDLPHNIFTPQTVVQDNSKIDTLSKLPFQADDYEELMVAQSGVGSNINTLSKLPSQADDYKEKETVQNDISSLTKLPFQADDYEEQVAAQEGAFIGNIKSKFKSVKALLHSQEVILPLTDPKAMKQVGSSIFAALKEAVPVVDDKIKSGFSKFADFLTGQKTEDKHLAVQREEFLNLDVERNNILKGIQNLEQEKLTEISKVVNLNDFKQSKDKTPQIGETVKTAKEKVGETAAVIKDTTVGETVGEKLREVRDEQEKKSTKDTTRTVGDELKEVQDKQEKKTAITREQKSINYLKEIADKVGKPIKVAAKKGSGFLSSFLSGPKAIFGFIKKALFGPVGAIALILGGVGIVIKDVIKAYMSEEGGLSGILSAMWSGNQEVSFWDTATTVGKWAAIGAGAGTLIGGPIGFLGGGLIGGAIGMVAEMIEDLFLNASDKGWSSAIGTFMSGDTKLGFGDASKTIGKWALIGAGIGFPIAGPIGIIGGGLIGAGIGLVAEFIEDIFLNADEKGFVGGLKETWDTYTGANLISGFFPEGLPQTLAKKMSILPILGPVIGGLVGWGLQSVGEFIAGLFPATEGESLSDKLGNIWNKYTGADAIASTFPEGYAQALSKQFSFAPIIGPMVGGFVGWGLDSVGKFIASIFPATEGESLSEKLGNVWNEYTGADAIASMFPEGLPQTLANQFSVIPIAGPIVGGIMGTVLKTVFDMFNWISKKFFDLDLGKLKDMIFSKMKDMVPGWAKSAYGWVTGSDAPSHEDNTETRNDTVKFALNKMKSSFSPDAFKLLNGDPDAFSGLRKKGLVVTAPEKSAYKWVTPNAEELENAATTNNQQATQQKSKPSIDLVKIREEEKKKRLKEMKLEFSPDAYKLLNDDPDNITGLKTKGLILPGKAAYKWVTPNAEEFENAATTNTQQKSEDVSLLDRATDVFKSVTNWFISRAEEVAKLATPQINDAITTAKENLTKQTKAGKYQPTDGMSKNEKAMAWFTSKEGGAFTKEQAAGIVGNLNAESNLKADAFNPAGGGQGAQGIAQWRGSRVSDFKEFSGKDLKDASLEEQLKFVTYEMTEGKEKSAGRHLRKAGSAQEAAKVVDDKYERSGGHHLARRQKNAMEAMQVDLEKTVVAEITSQVSEAIQIAKKKVVETAAKVAPVIKSGIKTTKTGVAETTAKVSEVAKAAKDKVVETAAKVAPVIKSGIKTTKTGVAETTAKVAPVIKSGIETAKTGVAETTAKVSEVAKAAKDKVVETAAKVAPVIKSGIETAKTGVAETSPEVSEAIKTAQVTEPSAVPVLPLSTSVVDTRIEQFAKTEQQLKKLQSEIEEFKKKNKGLTDLPGPSELDAFSDDNTVEGYKDSELNNKFSELKSKLRDTETNKRKLIQDEIAQQAVFVKPRTITRKGRRGARQREAAKKVAKIRNDVRLLELGQRKGIVTTEKDADGAISFTYKEKDAIKNAIEKEMQEKSKQIGMTAKDATKQTSPEVSEAIKTAQVTEPVIDTKQTSPEVSEAIKTAQVTEPSAVPVIKSGIKSTKDVGKGWADKIANSLKLSNLLGGLTKDIVELTSPEITEAVKTAKEKLIEVTAKPVSVIKSGVKTVGNVVKLAKNKVTETAKDIIELTSPQITDVVKTAKEKITKVTAKTAPVIKSGITQLASRVSETAKAAKDKVVKPVAKSKSKRPSREWGTFEEDVSDIIRPVVKSKRTNRDSLGDLVDDGGNFKPTVTAPVIKSGIAQLASRVSETTKAAKFKVGKTASVTKDIVNQTSPQVSEAIKTAKVNVVKSPVKVALTEEELRAEFNTTHGESFREKEDAITAKYAKPKGGRRARDEMNVSFDQMDDEWELDDEKAIAYAKFKEERLVAGKAQDITTQKFKNITGSIKTVSAAQGVYIKPRISTESFPAELHPNEAVLPLNDIRSQKAIGESISKSIATAPRPVTEIKPVPIIQPQQPAIPQQTQSVTPPPAPVPATTNETESITDAVTQQFIDKIFTNTINVFQQSIKTFAMGQSPFMV